MKAESFILYHFGDTSLFNLDVLKDKTLLRKLPIYEEKQAALEAYIELDVALEASFAEFGSVAYFGAADGQSAICHVVFNDLDKFNAWKVDHAVDLHTLGVLRQDLLLPVLHTLVSYADLEVTEPTTVTTFEEARAAMTR